MDLPVTVDLTVEMAVVTGDHCLEMAGRAVDVAQVRLMLSDAVGCGNHMAIRTMNRGSARSEHRHMNRAVPMELFGRVAIRAGHPIIVVDIREFETVHFEVLTAVALNQASGLWVV